MTEHTRKDVTAFMEFPIRVRDIDAPLDMALDMATELLIDTLETTAFERHFLKFLPDGIDILDFDGLDINYYMVDPLDENGELSDDPSSCEEFVDQHCKEIKYVGASGTAANNAAYAIMAAMNLLMNGDVEEAKYELAIWLRLHVVNSVAGISLSDEVRGYIKERLGDGK